MVELAFFCNLLKLLVPGAGIEPAGDSDVKERDRISHRRKGTSHSQGPGSKNPLGQS